MHDRGVTQRFFSRPFGNRIDCATWNEFESPLKAFHAQYSLPIFAFLLQILGVIEPQDTPALNFRDFLLITKIF